MSNHNNCENRREEITALVLGELEAAAAEQLKKHIETCPACRTLYQALAEEEETVQSAFNAIADRGKKIENALVAHYDTGPDKPSPEPAVLRQIQSVSGTKRRLIKIAAAAIIIVALSIYGWFSRQQAPLDETQFDNGLSLLSRACAAEQILFSQSGIAHILNEIIVYPVPEGAPPSDYLDKFDLTPSQRQYLETVNSWLDYNWLPLCSLQANGQFRFNQLKLSKDIGQSYTVTDEAWYDSSTGYFARVMKMGTQVVFANSYDGEFIYFSERDPAGSLRLLSERVRAGFNPPQNPAEFLGITAGLQSSIQKDDYSQVPVLEITKGAFKDGTPVSIYKLGFVNLLGQADTYWLFKVREDNNIVAEMEFILAGSPQFLIRRVLSESVDRPPLSWDLARIDLELHKTEESPKVAVNPDIVLPNVSIRHMVDKAGFETYIFAVKPPWTDEPEIIDFADFASPGKRMFAVVYRARDGRHLIMSQTESFNSFFSSLLKQVSGNLIYTSSNGFKLWAGGPEKWWTELHIRSCGFAPADDRTGYVCESPTGTFASLAINGRLSDEELTKLVDRLVPARKVLELSREELQELIEALPPGRMEYNPLTDPNHGMPADGLTKQQAMVKIAEEYWNAIISGDWDYVAKLRPFADAEFWRDLYSRNPVLEFLEAGRPYKPELPCSGLLVPCIIKLQDGKTVEKTLVVRYRIINGKSSCVIPAMWDKTRTIE